MSSSNRQIFLHGALGVRQLKEVLSNLLIGLILCPDDVWMVSPWITDFQLLDNRAGDWNSVQPSWGARYINLSELLILAVDSGCKLHLVTTSDEINDYFLKKLVGGIQNSELFKLVINDKLHTKGLLCSSFFLAGSMNFTYSGANKNDEHIQLTTNKNSISEAKLEFEHRYNAEVIKWENG
jgi:PLD-like domain